MDIVRFLFVLLVFIGSHSGISQGKFDKLIEAGKFSKVEKKIEKKLSKDSRALDYLYSKVMLYNTRDYKDYSTELAYQLGDELANKFVSLPQNDQTKYGKDGLTSLSISSLRSSVIQNAYDDVMVSTDIAQYEAFLQFYKTMDEGKRVQLKTRIYELAYQQVKEQNSVEAYNNFLNDYPLAPQKNTVILSRNKKAFENAKEENTAEAFKVFIYTYPDAIQVNMAWQYIYKMEFDRVSASTNYRDYVSYMSEYPKSPFKSVAEEKYELYLYQEKTRSQSMDDYISFIQDYPKNRYRNEAINRAFQVGVKSNDFLMLKYVAEKLGSYGEISAIVQSMYQIIRMDGRSSYLNKFYGEYGEYVDELMYKKDLEVALRYDNLNLKDISFTNYNEIDQFIRDAAPRAIGLNALISMCRAPIDAENWSEATKVFKKYRSDFDGNKDYNKTLALLEESVINDFKKTPIDEKLNTEDGNEYVPIMSADGTKIFFCGQFRPDNLGGEDIFISTMNGLSWSEPRLMEELCTYNNNEAPLSITVDGTKMTLFINGKVYETNKTINGWSEPELMDDNINQGTWNADLNYTGDGQAVLFTSIREGGYNYASESRQSNYYASDIYVSIKDMNGEWQEPINLGPIINTAYTERTPFLHPDMKTLYFSSNGHGGLGGLDVFMCTRLSEESWTEWSEPINLGKYFNTSGSNWGYKITTDGKRAYFSEQKSSKETNQDLFWLKLPPRLRPELVATIKGNLKDREEKPIGARLVIQDLASGNVVAEANSDPTNGEFFVVLPLGKIYGYHVDKKEFYPISGNIDLREEDNAVEKLDNIEMVTFEEMIKEGLAVPVNNLFFDFGKSDLLPESKPELKRIAKILLEAPDLKIRVEGHTDNVGSEEFNHNLSLKRCNAVKHFLISEGCSPDQVKTIGYGQEKPKATNETEGGRAQNRRVELRFIK